MSRVGGDDEQDWEWSPETRGKNQDGVPDEHTFYTAQGELSSGWEFDPPQGSTLAQPEKRFYYWFYLSKKDYGFLPLEFLEAVSLRCQTVGNWKVGIDQRSSIARDWWTRSAVLYRDIYGGMRTSALLENNLESCRRILDACLNPKKDPAVDSTIMDRNDPNFTSELYRQLRYEWRTGLEPDDYPEGSKSHPWAYGAYFDSLGSTNKVRRWLWCPLVSPTGLNQRYVYIDFNIPKNTTVVYYMHFDIFNILKGFADKSARVTALPARQPNDGSFYMCVLEDRPEPNVESVTSFFAAGLRIGRPSQWVRYDDSREIKVVFLPVEAAKFDTRELHSLLNKIKNDRSDILMSSEVVDKVPLDTEFIPLHVQYEENDRGEQEMITLPDPLSQFYTYVHVKTWDIFSNKWKPITPPNVDIKQTLSASKSTDFTRYPLFEVMNTDRDDPPSGLLSSASIRNARGKRRGQPGMKSPSEGVDAWRYSTRDLANGLGIPMGDQGRVPSLEIDGVIVWKQNLAEFEWCHKVAFSFGAFGENRTSGSRWNFFMGTSFTNSLMTWYEKTMQSLVQAEDAVRAVWGQALDANVDAIQGTIVAPANRHADYPNRSITPSSSVVTIQACPPGASALDSTIRDAPWFLSAISWRATIPSDLVSASIHSSGSSSSSSSSSVSNWAPDQSLLLGRKVSCGRKFYAFDRPFFTKVESLLEQAMLEVLKERSSDFAFLRNSPVAAASLKLSRMSIPSGPMGSRMTRPDSDHDRIWEGIVQGADHVLASNTAIARPFVAVLGGRDQATNQRLVLKRSLMPATLNGAQAIARTGGKTADVAVAATMVRAVAPDLRAAMPPAGFVSGGSIKLFGQFSATLYQYNHDGSRFEPTFVYMMVDLDQALNLGSLAPSLASSAFNAISIENLRFTYCNAIIDIKALPSLTMEGDIVFNGALGDINVVLTKFFGQKDPRIHVQAALGNMGFDIGTPFRPSGFTLSGSLPGISVKIGDEHASIELTDVGVNLHANPCMRRNTKGDWAHSFLYDYSFWGIALVRLPGSPVPMQMRYELDPTPGHLTLRIRSTGPWSNAAGVQGLTLGEVSLTVAVPRGNVDQASTGSLSLQIFTSLQLYTSTIFLSGYYSSGALMLAASLTDFTLDDLAQAFKVLTGESFAALEGHDVRFDSIRMMLQTGTAAAFTFVGSVTIGGYTSATATIQVARSGISIRGDIDDIHIGDVAIQRAQLQIELHSESSGTLSSFLIAGTFDVLGLSIKVGLFIEDKVDGHSPAWAVYGELHGDLKVSTLVSGFRSVPTIDLTLSRVAIIAASDDKAGSLIVGDVLRYPVKKGIQICATIKEIGLIDQLLGGSNSGFVFACRVDGSTAKDLFIQFPGARTFNLGSGVTTGPLGIELQAGIGATPPRMMLQASMNIPVPDQTDPLVFMLGLALEPTAAEGSAEMRGWWNNPFGISKQIAIGPVLAVALKLQYAGGIPSSLAFVGGVKIGSKILQVSFKIGDQPLLAASTNNLALSDIISFANDIAEVNIPSVPEDVLEIQDVAFYLSSGVTIGDQVFPAGASLQGAIRLFGYGAKMKCSIGTAIEVDASMDGFAIGPLVVKGASNPNPQASIKISPNIQHVMVDGYVDFLGIEKQSIRVTADLLPSPNFQFSMMLDFVELLRFQLDGKLMGKVTSLTNLSDLDFTLSATMQQELIDYVITQVNLQFGIINHAIEHGIDDAKQRLNAAQKKFDDAVSSAQADVAKTSAEWQAISQASQQKLDNATKLLQQELPRLRAAVNQAKAGFSAAFSKAANNIATVTSTGAAAVADAQSKLDQAYRATAAQVQQAQDAVNKAVSAMNAKFGDVEGALSTAQSQVKSIQGEINRCDDQIRINEAKAKASIFSSSAGNEPLKRFSWDPSSWNPATWIPPPSTWIPPTNLLPPGMPSLDPSTWDYNKVNPAQIPWGQVNPAQVDWNRIDPSQVSQKPVDWTQVDQRGVDWAKIDLVKVPWNQINPRQVNWSVIDPVKVNWRVVDPSKVNWSAIDPNVLPWPNPETEQQRLQAIAVLPGLYMEKASLLAALNAASIALNAAKAAMSGADYIASQAVVQTTKTALAAALAAQTAALNAASDVLSQVQTTSDAALLAAEAAMPLAQEAAEATLTAAQTALDSFQNATNATIAAAQASLNALMQGPAYLAFQAAQAALLAAKASSHDLDAANAALDIAQKASTGAVNVAAWGVQHAGEFVNIRQITLAGQLRALVDGAIDTVHKVSDAIPGVSDVVDGASDVLHGKSGEGDQAALEASVQGVVVGKSFSISVKFYPKQATRLVTDITEQLWREAKAVLGV
ncbi:hypothetical protein FB567DRAFT_609954 [Paraphoma chrysanthemicola]|uniref:Uncharacterized protein n=1 Tax=Paraphoma chrysanthemicola TaxID=798071 RepID=A0A8K0RHE3_9PLEO|nr:hypothetical protein FB567DRAFT_609954 [Paraphoma chrysanthemicola]